ncbi:MAG: trypsin-like peptidase domain-containing protein [Aeriscardovia sp.]|nr:trypsin-like peptidase domain-containing protein [Aeriscardovia sp.]
MALIPRQFIDSVVSIGSRNSDNSISWFGTGFFVGRSIDDPNKVVPFLVTNKHVLQLSKQIVVRIKENDSERLIEMDVILEKDGLPSYKIHPQNDIDIAVLQLDASVILDKNLIFQGFNIDTQALSSVELREEGVDEGSLIYMLGFPMGLVNQTSNLPLCRLGCIARMSEAQINENHNILVDVQNFPGNSGSPIVLRPDTSAIIGTKSLNRSVLVGIIHSYIPYQEQLVNSQTRRVVEVRSENSGIANAHPVEYIRDVIDMYLPSPNL